MNARIARYNSAMQGQPETASVPHRAIRRGSRGMDRADNAREHGLNNWPGWAGEGDPMPGRNRRMFAAINTARTLGAFSLAVLATTVPTGPARAVPSFAEQTGQPCAACHVGAFGPQLKPYGRNFKLRGYTAADDSVNGGKWKPALAATVQTTFTRTNSDQQPPMRWYAPNNNFALDQVSLYYAGRFAPNVGGFIQATYDGVARVVHIDNADIRYAREFQLAEEDKNGFDFQVVAGITANNSPTVSDLWNSTPVWGFPYNTSAIAPSAVASALIDGGLGQRVAGAGVYALWNEWVYTEFALYRGLGRDVLNATGIVPVSGTNRIEGLAPYWRLAVQHDWDNHSFQIGTYGIHVDLYPGGDRSAGTTDGYTDTAFDANYQYIVNPDSVVSDMLSVHTTLIHENQNLSASRVLSSSNARDTLNTFRVDASYSFNATVTPSIQYFRTWGSPDANVYAPLTGNAGGSPNTSGFIGEIAYVPFGKPDSLIKWGNVRFALQYVAYTEFNGTSHGASANNALFASVWFATHF